MSKFIDALRNDGFEVIEIPEGKTIKVTVVTDKDDNTISSTVEIVDSNKENKE